MAKGMIADVKRHAMKSFQEDVPCGGFAIGGKYREHGGADQHQQPPWDAIAEGAQQLRQIDLGHLVGSPHHPQPFALAGCRTYRRKTTGHNRDE